MSIELIPDRSDVACFTCEDYYCGFVCFATIDKFNHEVLTDHTMKTIYEDGEPFNMSRHIPRNKTNHNGGETTEYSNKKWKEIQRRKERKNKGRSHD
jgi:hypothetical protein